jgi:hypothetical protein
MNADYSLLIQEKENIIKAANAKILEVMAQTKEQLLATLTRADAESLLKHHPAAEEHIRQRLQRDFDSKVEDIRKGQAIQQSQIDGFMANMRTQVQGLVNGKPHELINLTASREWTDLDTRAFHDLCTTGLVFGQPLFRESRRSASRRSRGSDDDGEDEPRKRVCGKGPNV